MKSTLDADRLAKLTKQATKDPNSKVTIQVSDLKLLLEHYADMQRIREVYAAQLTTSYMFRNLRNFDDL